jgi:hypothetical protein
MDQLEAEQITHTSSDEEKNEWISEKLERLVRKILLHKCIYISCINLNFNFIFNEF